MVFEDFASAHNMVLMIVLGLAFILGAVVNKTNFCTMGALSDWVNIGDTGRFRAWVMAMTVALIGVTALEASGMVNLDNTFPPYRGSNFAWFEYLLGGIIFGVGMTLGSGCGNKALIRIGGGNLKSIIVFAVISVCAYFMLNPFPGTDKTIYSEVFYHWTSLASVSLTTNQDLGSVVAGLTSGSAGTMRTIIGAVLVIAMLWFVLKSKDFRSSFDHILAGIVVGLVVVTAWYVTSSMVTISVDGEDFSWNTYASAESWDMMEDDSDARPRDVAIQSFTFINPIGQTLRYAINDFNASFVTFGLMAVLGVVLGSFFWSIVSGAFHFEWFASIKDFVMHVIGGILMGTGGVLALGCTVGQAITGISTLAMGSFIAFFGIALGCAMTMKVQLYKMVYEDAGWVAIFITSLVDLRLLPRGLRKLESI